VLKLLLFMHHIAPCAPYIAYVILGSYLCIYGLVTQTRNPRFKRSKFKG
jgi:hypothetical protein